jgi:hypothetical protein
VTIDDLDPDAGVGITGAAGRRESGRSHEHGQTEDGQRTCRVVPTVVARPKSSITVKTRL